MGQKLIESGASGSHNYSAGFTLDFSASNLDLLNAKQLDIEYKLYAVKGYSTVGLTADLYYTDGTYQTLTTGVGRHYGELQNLIFDLDETKQIDYIYVNTRKTTLLELFNGEYN